MKSVLIVLITLISFTSAIAIPQDNTNEPTTGGVNPLYPECVNVTYYQDLVTSDADTCGMQVANDTIEADYCNSLCTAGISIAQAPNNLCTFTLYTGSPSCDTNDGGEKISHPIPAGNGTVCVSTGVEDGCDVQSASGVWSCR